MLRRWLPILPLLFSASQAAVIDLDLRPTGQRPPPGLQLQGTAWTEDGLFLPAGPLTPFPPGYPIRQRDVPPSPPPYQAEIAISGLRQRNLTVTLLVCLASRALGQDNLFTVGRRSRWLAAQVGQDDSLQVGLDNRWWMLTPRRDGQALMVPIRRWHAVSIGVDTSSLVRCAVDGVLADDQRPQADARRPLPLRYDGPEENVLACVDPGSARHLNGLVARLIVHDALLGREEIAALHHQLAPASLPPPQAREFTQAQPVVSAFPTPAAPEPLPAPANDF
jgi:hypothetical protein